MRFAFLAVLILLLTVSAVILISCGGSASTSSGTAVEAPGALGAVTSATSVTCPTSATVAGTCMNLTVSNCAQATTFSPVLLKITQPVGTSKGTIVFTTGGTGIPLYEELMTYGDVAINDVVNAGFTAVQTAFQGGQAGWLTGPAPDGPLALVCRWTTAAQWIHDNVRQANSTFCATGNSAGAGAIAYALSRYNQESIFNFVVPTSGPPFSRIDQGCVCNNTRITSACAGSVDPCYGLNANMFLDPAYGNTDCSQGKSSGVAQWQKDSILSSDGKSLLNYTTPMHFIFGGLDASSGVAEAALYLNAVQSQHDFECVADAPHEIASVPDGAAAVANALINGCH